MPRHIVALHSIPKGSVLLISLVGDITKTNALVIPVTYAALMYQHINTQNEYSHPPHYLSSCIELHVT